MFYRNVGILWTSSRAAISGQELIEAAKAGADMGDAITRCPIFGALDAAESRAKPKNTDVIPRLPWLSTDKGELSTARERCGKDAGRCQANLGLPIGIVKTLPDRQYVPAEAIIFFNLVADFSVPIENGGVIAFDSLTNLG